MCIVKPHALKERKLGLAMQLIDEAGFDITALNMFTVDKVNAAEFYEVYKGIVPEYKVTKYYLLRIFNEIPKKCGGTCWLHTVDCMSYNL